MFAQDKSSGKPLLVSGVPPDAFSATGQLWGRCDLFIITILIICNPGSSVSFFLKGHYKSDLFWYLSRFSSPLYDWKAMSEDGYTWWIKRMKRAFDLYDEFRIDHFRGLAGYWAIPAGFELFQQLDFAQFQKL